MSQKIRDIEAFRSVVVTIRVVIEVSEKLLSFTSFEMSLKNLILRGKIIPGVQLKSGPYGPYFNISNLFTHFLLALAF